MFELLKDLLSPEVFMPHGHCYLWKPSLLWLQVVSNALIGLSYVAISATLYYLVKKGEYVPFKGMALAFGAFIITCGLTHFLDIYVIWEPAYWLDGGVRAVTALASVGTALLLPPLIPRAIAVARGARRMQDRGIELQAAVEDLETMYEKTKELEELKTQFFANVSHELRTPLALILGPAEKLLGADNLTEEQRRDTEIVVRNARTLHKHVNDLLDVSRLEAGKLGPSYARDDLARLVKLVAAHFDGAAVERGTEFVVEAPASLAAEFDPDKMRRVVLNLLSNAFKFTPSRGRVHLTLKEVDGDRALIDVADSGPGVHPSQRDIVFERFRQAEGGVTRRFGGTGLGLAISRDFVDLHGGSISVLDAPEGGALFRVELPLRAPEGAEISEAAEPEAAGLAEAAKQALQELRERVEAAGPAGEGERPVILVVEDNPEMNRFVCETLATAGYQTEAAFDGKVGLEKAVELGPDLVVSDIMMPEMSGDQLVEEIRRRDELDNLPILLLTAKADDELRVELLKAGAQDYLMKPFPAEELKARAENLVTMKRARDVLQSELESQVGDLERLATEVTHRRRELQTALDSMRVAREQAERASQLKTNFLSMVSHELRSPLATLELQLARLRAEQEGAAQPRLLDRMNRSTGRLHALIESLLHYARVQSGRLHIRREPVDVDELMEDVIEEIRPRAEEKRLAVELERPGSVPALHSDRRLVRLILVNLLSNAVKFTRTGSIALARTYEEGTHRFVVRDTGPGIPPEEQARIFEPFEQVAAPRRKHLAGVGLGLALVRELVGSLRGSIMLESKLGRGSRFTVSLPDDDDAETEEEGREVGVPHRG